MTLSATGGDRRLKRLPDMGRSIGGNVTSILRAAIITGDLQPGDRLGQDELCAELGVSQAPVREALRKLEAEGLVQHRPNRGVFVLGLPREELLNVVAPTRVLLEAYAVKRVLATRKAELLDILEALVADMAIAADAGDISSVHDLDVAFHEAAVLLADQPHTLQLWRSIMPRVRAEFTRIGAAHSPEDIVEEHRNLLAVYRAGKARAIDAAVHDHAITRTKWLLDRAEAANGLANAKA